MDDCSSLEIIIGDLKSSSIDDSSSIELKSGDSSQIYSGNMIESNATENMSSKF